MRLRCRSCSASCAASFCLFAMPAAISPCAVRCCSARVARSSWRSFSLLASITSISSRSALAAACTEYAKRPSPRDLRPPPPRRRRPKAPPRPVGIDAPPMAPSPTARPQPMPTAELSAIWSVGAVPPPAPARPSLPGVPVVPRSRAALTVEVNATHESPTSARMRFSSAVPCAMVRPAPERSPREAAPRAPACVIAATPMARCSPPHVVIRALTPVPTSAMACAVRRPHASALPVRLANCCTIRVMGPSGPESPSSSSFTEARKVRSPILSDSLNRSSAVAESSVAGPSCCTVRMNASKRSCAVCD